MKSPYFYYFFFFQKKEWMGGIMMEFCCVCCRMLDNGWLWWTMNSPTKNSSSVLWWVTQPLVKLVSFVQEHAINRCLFRNFLPPMFPLSGPSTSIEFTKMWVTNKAIIIEKMWDIWLHCLLSGSEGPKCLNKIILPPT